MKENTLKTNVWSWMQEKSWLKEQHTQDNAIAKETLMLDHTHAKYSSCNTWAQWNPSTPEVPLTTMEDMLLSVNSI